MNDTLPPPPPAANGLLRIEHGRSAAEIAPVVGGSLAAFFDDEAGARTHWLRPATEQALQTRHLRGMASFPLLPWCNRIRDGRFVWQGRTVQLPPDPLFAHALHGLGWKRPWTVTAHSRSHVELALDGAAGPDWPFDFRALQRYALDDKGLAIELSLRNTGSASMPAGIGHHPYVWHRREGSGTHVHAVVDGIWEADAAVLPTGLSHTHPAIAALGGGLALADFVLDNNFTGFGREARVQWPDGRGLLLRSTAPLDHLVIYSPAGMDHFCIEAVSNCTDWINLRAADVAAPVGGSVLQPGEVLQATTWLLPLRP